MRRITWLALTIVFFTLCSTSLLPQQTESHAPDAFQGFRFGIINITIRTIPDAPFTANVRAELIRTLADGNTMVRKNHRLVARDSSGRVFEERRYITADDDVHQSSLFQTDLRDPIAHEMYVCDGTGQLCHLYFFAPPPSVPEVPFPGVTGQVTRVNIGTAMISGVETIGTREITIIPAKDAGTSHPVTLSKEFWYSPQLGINIRVTRIDPRAGTENFLVDDLNVGEPDTQLFEVPTGANIIRETTPAPWWP